MGRLVAVKGDPDAEIGALFHAGGTVAGILGLLSGRGLDAMPDFVCLQHEGSALRIVVRGEAAVRCEMSDGTEREVDGRDSLTWREDILRDVRVARVELHTVAIEWAIEPSLSNASVIRGKKSHADPQPASPSPAATATETADSSKTENASTLNEEEFEALEYHGEPAPPRQASVSVTERSHPTQSPPPATPGIIASVPGMEASTPEPSKPLADERPQETESSGSNSLGRDTSSIQDPIPAGAVHDGLGERDKTISLAELRRLQAGGGDGLDQATGSVRARRCRSGHVSPPTADRCRVCGTSLDGALIESIPRPTLVRLVFDSGLEVAVDRPQLIGSDPSPSKHPDTAELPALVTLPDEEGVISRSHLAVRIEGWDVLIEDLGSTNGTMLTRPGWEPELLRENQPQAVVPGARIEFAHAAACTVEAPST